MVGIASDGRVLLKEVDRLKPDLVCLDVSMPETNGIQAATQLAEKYPRLKMLFVTQQLGLPYLKAAFRAGASGYVTKRSASTEIVTAVMEVLAGRRFITPLIDNEQYGPRDLERNLQEAFVDTLTDRQRQVLQLLAEGRTSKSISEIMAISPKTVEYHKTNLMSQLGLKSLAELIRYAVAQNIVE